MTRVSARRLGSYHPGASAKISATCNPSGQTAKQIADLGAPAPCRRNAGAALWQDAGGPRTRLPALVRLLQDSDVQVRISGVVALRDIAEEPDLVEPALIASLSDSEFKERRAAIARSLPHSL